MPRSIAICVRGKGGLSALLSSFRFRTVFLLALCLLATALTSWRAFGLEPKLVPEPRDVKPTGSALVINSRLEIALPTPVASGTRFAAARLARELKRASGLNIPIVSVSRLPRAKSAIVLGSLGNRLIRKRLSADGVTTEGIGAQGYALDVNGRTAVVGGEDSAGLFYGVDTLRQLVVGKGDNARVLGVKIRDWPALAYRGTQVDLSRGPVPKLATLERIVRRIAAFKLNQLYLYMEDAFPVKGQPLVGVLSDQLTQSDFKALVAYAAPYHVEIVPATEACGHLHKLMRFEEYSRFAERPHGAVIAVGDPRGAAFLKTLYSQMTAVFPSPVYNIGCDETFELGLGRSKSLVDKEGYGPVYLESLKTAASIVESDHKRVMFWGDMAVKHPEIIPDLPPNWIAAPWEYGYHRDYSRWVEPFAGREIFVCPWIANTSVLVPDDEEAAANIAGMLAAGRKAHAVGADITVWNDDGEMLYGVNWWGILYGAASAWEPHRVSVPGFNAKFDWVFYRNPGHQFAQAIAEISNLNEVLRAGSLTGGLKRGYGAGAYDSYFWTNPFSPAGHDIVQKELPIAPDLRLAAERAYTVFKNDSDLAQTNADTLENYEFDALRLDDLGMRIEYAQEISNYYADAVAHEFDHGPSNPVGDDLANISSTNGRLQDLRDYTTRLREMYKQLYLRENLPHWMPNMLQLYDHDSERWQTLISHIAQAEVERYHGVPLPSPDTFGFLPATPTAP